MPTRPWSARRPDRKSSQEGELLLFLRGILSLSVIHQRDEEEGDQSTDDEVKSSVKDCHQVMSIQGGSTSSPSSDVGHIVGGRGPARHGEGRLLGEQGWRCGSGGEGP